MNKLDRKVKGLTKQKRRIKIWEACSNSEHPISDKTKQKLKTMSTPCSCNICSASKNLVNGENKKLKKEIELAFI